MLGVYEVSYRTPAGVECATCEVHGTVREVGAASVTLTFTDDIYTWPCHHRSAKRWDSRVGERVALRLAYIPDSSTEGYRMLAVGMRRLKR